MRWDDTCLLDDEDCGVAWYETNDAAPYYEAHVRVLTEDEHGVVTTQTAQINKLPTPAAAREWCERMYRAMVECPRLWSDAPPQKRKKGE